MKRKVKILKYLMHNEGFVTINNLSKLYKVSTRTIRDDLNAVENYLDGTNFIFVRDRMQGVSIDRSCAGKRELSKLMSKIDSENTYFSEEERFQIMIRELLLAQQYVTYDYLITKTKTSKTTAIKDLEECEKWLGQRKIRIVRRTGIGIKIECDELTWRTVALEAIEKFSGEFEFTNLCNCFPKKEVLMFQLSKNSLMSYFTKNVNLAVINNFIKKYEQRQQIKFSEDSFIKIFFYILIAVKRAGKGNMLRREDLVEYDFVDLTGIEEWLKENLKFLSVAAGINMNEPVMKFILIYMLSQSRQYDKDTRENSMFDEHELTQQFIKIVQDFLCINLLDDEALLWNLKMHISSTVHRILFGIEVKNSLKDEIRNMYPEIFKACCVAGGVFRDKLGKSPSEDEVGFLTMHIAAFLEKTKKEQMKLQFVRAVIVCSSGVGTSNILHMRLLNEFPDLVIEKVCSVEEFDRLDKREINLVISTTPLSFGVKESVIYVSPLLNEKDIIRIRKFISTSYVKGHSNDSFVVGDLMDIISKNCIIKDYQGLELQIQRYFIKQKPVYEDDQPMLSELAVPEHILLQAEAENWEEAVRLGGELMYRSGCVEKTYIQKMVDAKEELGPNIVIARGIALPHAKSVDGVKETCMAFLTLRHPVCFGNEAYDPVSFVILLGASQDHGHMKALAELIELLDDDETIKQLCLCRDADKFTDRLRIFEKNSRQEQII